MYRIDVLRSVTLGWRLTVEDGRALLGWVVHGVVSEGDAHLVRWRTCRATPIRKLHDPTAVPLTFDSAVCH
jgi:hypothetical protein